MSRLQRTPELILCHADVRTQDPARPRAQALAIAAERIVAVGGDDEIMSLAAPQTRVLALDGRLVVPGFIDTHFHFVDWALGHVQLELAGVRSLDEMLAQLAERAATQAEGSWILGQGFNEAAWPRPQLPTRADLDRAAPRHRVALWRCDLHLAVANSRALQDCELADRARELPPACLGRAGDGALDGVLREQAIDLLRAAIPLASEEQLGEAMRSGVSALHALGITEVHDVPLMRERDWARRFRVWQRLLEHEDVPLRCAVCLPGEQLEAAISLGLQTGFGSERLRLGPLKLFADGGMGARTAWMLEPYLDAACGLPALPLPELRELASRADRHGLALMIHAVGDRAAREVVTLYEDLQRTPAPLAAGPATGPRAKHRIEHLQMIQPADLARLAALDVAVSVQPSNMLLDIDLIDGCLAERGRLTYAFASIAAAGVPLCISSDCPVCQPDPLASIRAAVTRQRQDGTPAGGWYPAERLTLEQAFAAHTRVAAAISGALHRRGALIAGNDADIAIISPNPFDLPPGELARARVEMTLVAGRLVHGDAP